ncbi:ABC transporter permease [Nocardioides sp. MAH-18]|uniref:ABC transporter permease n=1 Tax=Nocardioides agri TaxID=2682843 RepID=A0A6L6Y0B0_9ACTN|nr:MULTISPECIES: ABC transporter permease [unclassified Nocardioides]MBA2952944.1 ABC transporter permease [Nocardioides sp. CGMCC 1.13656]MVQ52106.1 ABC transporter permease [Nocardioides sp. MAH-18]
MRKDRGVRFWVELVLTCVSAFLFLLTLASAEWIELVLGVEPDGGDGSLEWLITAGLLVVTIVLSLLTFRDGRRAASTAPSTSD